MVPCEEDMMALMRNEQEHSESEISRPKKKKNQDGTSRPACSWVHFSREFIKEYTASHPESSGLKVATKAASDAWKLMSPEEKSKYTNRAREVWDKYLSTTPARIPKPRRQTKLVTRCSPGRLLNVLQRLTPDQKAAVKSMGFGSILNLRCRTLRRSLCLWLLEKFNTVRRSLEICGERIPLTPQDVELVMGFASSGKDVVNSGPDELIAELRKKYNATNRGISVRLLEERLAVPEAGEDFKRSFLLYLLGTLLCPTARLDVSPSFLHFLTNMDTIHQYNWGKFLLDRLVREVARYRQGKQRAVGGCLLFLQLFYYESVAVGEPSELSPAIFPCLSSWGEEEISEREKQERELGGYGCGEVVCKERGLGMGMLGYRTQSDSNHLGVMPPDVENYSLPEQVGYQGGEDQINGGMFIAEENMPINGDEGNTVCVDIDISDPVRAPCRNAQYGCAEIVDYNKRREHEDVCISSPCAFPLWKCHYVGSSAQLSEHFSSKHWDSGRRFQYNCPLPITLNKNEAFLVLQAEKDGILFLLNKGTESIGHTVMITCISPSSSKEQYLYDILSERGNSCLRLKSYTNNFPGRVEGSPPVDFLLVPYGFVDATGKLDLELCIWNSTDIGAD
ncbi:RING-type E3 ubiquitin transferase [Salvia divinorum]|uniref:RING-type E3 ubiquitin transferase n=1 Tax=Salvia divinorum TaxID=28513 RepID=A0ABD1FI65_SALDI